jgi:TonB family protein
MQTRARVSSTLVSSTLVSPTLVIRRFFFAVLFLVCIPLTPSLSAQDIASKRRIVIRSAPAYPALARHMALSGLVKIDALVAPDGTVKAVDIRGGHPVLAQAASNTIRQWKWEPASHESHEQVEIRFTPPE